MSSDKYIDVANIIKEKSPGLYRWLPHFVLRYFKKILHESEINGIMSRTGHLEGLAFAEAAMGELNAQIEPVGLENIPEKGGVILAANHPLGGLDGIAFLLAVGKKRPDIQLLVNDVLLNIKNLSSLFVAVNKFGVNPRQALKIIDDCYASDKVTMIFPAGMVSRKLPNGVADLEWQKSFISKAKNYQRNVVPVYIDCQNSNFFYNLSKWRTKFGIKANLEMFYLVDELFKQRNKKVQVCFGKSIAYSTFDSTKSKKQWAAEVRAKVYELAPKGI